MKDSEKFEEWYKSLFICSLSPASPLLISDNKAVEGKSLRMLEICKMILDNPNQEDETTREEIALRFFISMRVSLDYLHYARMILEKWDESKKQTEK
jgi:hypothetical protein